MKKKVSPRAKKAKFVPAAKTAPKKAFSQQTPAAGVLLSINEAAEEFGCDRHTLSKRVRDANLFGAGDRNGYPVYRLRDLIRAWRAAEDGNRNPDNMTPFERQAHFKAESERLRLDIARGAALKREIAEMEWARVLKSIALELDTIVDELERDVGLSTAQLEKIEEKLDAVRTRMYERIVYPAQLQESETMLPLEISDAPGTVS